MKESNLLDPRTILQLAPKIKVIINSSTNIEILVNGGQVKGGPWALTVLNTFSQPLIVSEAIKELQGRINGAQDWINLMDTIMQFCKVGVLIDSMQIESRISTNSYGFDSTSIHTKMLNDKVRTAGFFAGIREVVRPGDVVVDIGTGTGVLAIAAARAGARHVYAIEASAIGEAAKAIFEANGLADRITLIPGWSTQVSLPEHADVLVSEIIGNEPLGEMILETTIDACKRLLKPNARLIPAKLKILGLPVTIPVTDLAKHTFTAETLKTWKAWYDIDFDPLRKIMQSSPRSFHIKPQKARDWKVLSDPVLLANVDLKTVKQPMVQNTVAATANISGDLNAVIIYFELEIGPSTVLSTHPAQAAESNHWSSIVWIITETLSLQIGDCFNVTYKYCVPGSQDKVQVARINGD